MASTGWDTETHTCTSRMATCSPDIGLSDAWETEVGEGREKGKVAGRQASSRQRGPGLGTIKLTNMNEFRKTRPNPRAPSHLTAQPVKSHLISCPPA